MNEYNKEYFKKEAEQERLKYFLESYELITGESLDIVKSCERPDFICKKDNGEIVGVELTQVTRGDPKLIQGIKLAEKQDFMSIEHALEMIEQRGIEKEKKRQEDDWRFSGSTILVIELADIPLTEIKGLITSEFLSEFLRNTGFIEIWLADFTGLEAYRNVELFCVYPEQWAGYCQREIQKPYG